MAELHESLHSLCPVAFSDVPTEPTELQSYLRSHFSAATLLVESVPLPPTADATPARSRANTLSGSTSTLASAASSADITPSAHRSTPINSDHTSLAKEWGKPIKLAAKDNPLGISVYKLGAKDGKGSWFARRSVHEGLPFERWKLGLRNELLESLVVQGGPGEGNVRGIGADKLLVDEKLDSTGRMQVYQLSAQFPGPTTPRDFVELILSTENAVEGKEVPKHYMQISKPCEHDECPVRNGFIRGKYESVEFIREIPVKTPKNVASEGDLKELTRTSSSLSKEAVVRNAKQKSSDALSEGLKASDGDSSTADEEMNPVEWIMITRSDPGGSVPRFMIDRGTPGGIVGDASKFLDWACQKEHPPSDKLEEEIHATSTNDDIDTSTDATNLTETVTTSSDNTGENTGLFSTVANAAHNALVETGLFAPLPPRRSFSSDSSSAQSFASAEDFLSSSSESTKSGTSFVKLSVHEKELEKLASRKARLDAKLAKVRSKELGRAATSSEAASEVTEKELSRVRKAEEKHAKEVKKVEDRHAREIEKLIEKKRRDERRETEKKEREQKKEEERKAKKEKEEQEKKAKKEREEGRKELENSKKELEKVKKERDLLKETVQKLQSENTKLVAKVGKMDGGLDLLKELGLGGGGGSGRSSRAGSIRKEKSVDEKS